MGYQPINTGTPDNNNGDSLYAGGSKINSNFAEIYSALAGSSANIIKISLNDLGAVTGNFIGYKSSTGKFESVSSTSLRALGNAGQSIFYITDNFGLAGIDSELSGPPNSQNLFLNGKRISTIRTYNTSSVALTRAIIDFNVGNTNVTSLSVYTSGVTVRGSKGLDVYIASAEDTASYQTIITSSSNGVRLYLNPVLDVSSGAVKAITDSSNSIAHTGFVKANLLNYVPLTTNISAGIGMIGGGDLSTTRTIGIDPIYNPNHCDGLLYRYSPGSNTIIITPGSATHYSFGTSGETPISNTSILSIVATSSTFSKVFATGWSTGTAGNIIIDSTSSASSWYYIYLIANSSGYTDFIATTQRIISSVSGIAPAGFSVIRRIGVFKTNASRVPLPFTTRRLAGNSIEYNWGKLSNSGAICQSNSNFSLHKVLATSLSPLSEASASAATAQSFNTSTLISIPPIPGIEARLNVIMNTSYTDSPPHVHMYGNSWSILEATSLIGPPLSVAQSMSCNVDVDFAVSVTSFSTITVAMSPDREFLTEANLSSSSFTSTGQYLRYVMVANITQPTTAQSHLSFETLGFTIAR